MIKKSELLLEIANTIKDKNAQNFKKQCFIGKYDLLKTHIEILNEKGAKIFDREIGSYTSVFTHKLTPYDTDIKNYVIYSLSEVLKDYILKINKKAKTFLIIGVGNKNYVSDSLGPKVVNQIIITRHAKINNAKVLDERLKSVCAFAPSVLGQTGIETFDIVKGIIEKISPDIVFVIDSLLASDYKYIGKCFQVSSNGLVPGSGVENRQKILDTNSLKVPTISIGVPLVITAESLVNSYVELDCPKLDSLIVTISDIENYVKLSSNIVATSLNLAINNKMTFDEILDYMS